MKIWKTMKLQEIVDFVSSYPTRAVGCKQLGIPLGSYQQVVFISVNGNAKIFSEVESGKATLSRAYKSLYKGNICSIDSLSVLSDKARLEVGKVSDFTAHVIKWGLVDIESYIDHYMTTGYMKQAQAKALDSHYWLMYEGFESNYLQMLGVVTAFSNIEKVAGKITTKDRERLKKGIFCDRKGK